MEIARRTLVGLLALATLLVVSACAQSVEAPTDDGAAESAEDAAPDEAAEDADAEEDAGASGEGGDDAPDAEDAAGETEDDACGRIVITAHPSYPPVAWAEDGELVGAAPALATEIGDELGLEVVVQDEGTWSAAQDAARAGDVDMILGVYMNEERQAWLDYVEPAFLLDPIGAFARMDAELAITSTEDLVGLRGVTDEGESFGTEMDAFIEGELDVLRTMNVEESIQTVVNGEADYWIYGTYPGIAELASRGIAGEVVPAAWEIGAQPLYMAFSKASACGAQHGEAFGTALQAKIDEGRAGALLDEAHGEWEMLQDWYEGE